MMRVARVVLFSAAIAGCTVGNSFTWDQVKLLKPGMTMQQVTDVMGAPPFVTTAGTDPRSGIPNGQTTATWAEGSLISGSKSLTLQFDADGKLVSVPPVPTK